MTTSLLILHGLVGVALLGALTHQSVGLFTRAGTRLEGFTARYLAVRPTAFSTAIAALFALDVLLGAVIYPAYRIDIRISFEDMGLAWAVGLFEMKEHAAGIGLGLLPVYLVMWRPLQGDAPVLDRRMITLLLALVVWFDFLVGHVLNNIRGFG
jgi:hypothetical protein